MRFEAQNCSCVDYPCCGHAGVEVLTGEDAANVCGCGDTGCGGECFDRDWWDNEEDWDDECSEGSDPFEDEFYGQDDELMARFDDQYEIGEY